MLVVKIFILLQPKLKRDMLVIPVKEGEQIDRALKRFKKKFLRTGTMKQLRSRKQFTKKSVILREQKLKAAYSQKLLQEEE